MTTPISRRETWESQKKEVGTTARSSGAGCQDTGPWRELVSQTVKSVACETRREPLYLNLSTVTLTESVSTRSLVL